MNSKSTKHFLRYRSSATAYQVGAVVSMAFAVLIFLFGMGASLAWVQQSWELARWQWMTLAMAAFGVSYLVAVSLYGAQVARLRKQLHTDEMTGLKNLAALQRDLQKLDSGGWQKGEPVALLLFDIDNFKAINDRFSYEVANHLLIAVGKVLRQSARASDEVYRYFVRGDEFLVVARATNLSNAHKVAERIRRSIDRHPIQAKGLSCRITVSCGVVEYREGESVDRALERVNTALQAAKSHVNKNKTVVRHDLKAVESRRV